MRRLLFTLLLSIVYCCTFGQPYQTGHLSATFIDSARGNRAVATEIYYPADMAGDNVAFAAAAARAPYIAFGHGFVMTYDAYFNIRDLVVPNGYIIAFPKTEGSLSPDHAEFGKDLAFVLKAVAALGNQTTSLLYGKVDTFNCVMGHSMGGGAAFLAMSYDPQIKSIVTFAAAETTPSAIGAAAAISARALVFAGLNDCVSPPAANQQPMYNALLSACKYYIGIKGGSHCQMAETNAACGFGEATCTPAPAISRATQHSIIDTLLLPWLDYTLRSSCDAGSHFDSKIATDTAITFLKNCDLCTTGITTLSTAHAIQLYPNPASDNINLSNIPATYTQLSILSVTGKSLLTATITNNLQLPVRDYPNGTYIYQLTGSDAPPIRRLFQVSK